MPTSTRACGPSRRSADGLLCGGDWWAPRVRLSHEIGASRCSPVTTTGMLAPVGAGRTPWKNRAIAETATFADDLALVVVDRLQRVRNPRLPLSGENLPGAVQVLRELARSQHVPVLAVLDTDDPAIVNLLDADVILTLTAVPGQPVTTVTVAERDLGIIGSTRLRPDLTRARFLDTDALPANAPSAGTAIAAGTVPDAAGSTCDGELADAALPFTSGAVKGLPAEATHLLAALRTALANGHAKDTSPAPVRYAARNSPVVADRSPSVGTFTVYGDCTSWARAGPATTLGSPVTVNEAPLASAVTGTTKYRSRPSAYCAATITAHAPPPRCARRSPLPASAAHWRPSPADRRPARGTAQAAPAHCSRRRRCCA